MKLFLNSSAIVGSALVLSGVVMKNGMAEQMGMDYMEMPGLISFVVGWLVVAYALKAQLAYVAVAGILLSVLQMKQKFFDLPAALPVSLFIASWVLIGYVLSLKVGWQAYAVPALVIASMLAVLPMQRDECSVDNFGMPMFTLAWVLLVAYVSNYRF